MSLIFPVSLIFLALAIAIKPLWKNRGFSCFILLFTGILIFSGYLNWGFWFPWKNHEAQLEKQNAIKTLLSSTEGENSIITRLEEAVLQSPEKPRGWYLLGRLYFAKKEWEKAVKAFQKARDLDPDDIGIHVNYAQALWEQNGRKFNQPIRSIFQELLKNNPEQADSLAMLAMDAYANGNNHQAIEYWEKLLALLPHDSQEALTIRQAIGKASEKSKNNS